MGDGYQATIVDIREASGAARDAAEIAGGVDLAAAIEPVGLALSGSRTAQSAGEVALFWRRQLTTWCADVTAYAANLSSAANRYERNEEQATADLGGAHHGGMRAE